MIEETEVESDENSCMRIVCHLRYFLNVKFIYKLKGCNNCNDIMIKDDSFSALPVVAVNGIDYDIYFHLWKNTYHNALISIPSARLNGDAYYHVGQNTQMKFKNFVTFSFQITINNYI